jgi:PAS domain S-box-containing protein
MEASIGERAADPRRTTALRYLTALMCTGTGVLLAQWLHPWVEASVFLLAAVLVVAWFSGLLPALLCSLLATLALDYFFIPPLYTLTPEPGHLARLALFACIAFLFASASASRRRTERALKQLRDDLEAKVRERTAELREQADLLDLTHDTIFVRDMNNVIRYWNRGAEEAYGWSREEALGRVSHDLTQTVFPAPLAQMTAQLMRDGRWEGELVHTKRDGSQVVVSSRWSLQRDAAGRPVAVLETNNDITERKRAEQQLEELAGRLIHAQEQERSRIGRELHDHISQTLGVLTIKIDQLRLQHTVPPTVAAALEELRRNTTEITDDVHSLSHRLHSSALDYLGLIPALQRLVSEFSARHGIAVEFQHTAIPGSLSSDVALCLFRVTEEGLTNIAKHSRAQAARIDVSGSADGIRLTVEDAGVGFDPTNLEGRAGLGFVSMRERLRALRGSVRVDSAPSRGTRIDVWVPAVNESPAVQRAAAPAPTPRREHLHT